MSIFETSFLSDSCVAAQNFSFNASVTIKDVDSANRDIADFAVTDGISGFTGYYSSVQVDNNAAFSTRAYTVITNPIPATLPGRTSHEVQNRAGFAALRSDGSVVTWGYGGDSTGIDFNGPSDNLYVTQIFSSGGAFAALLSNGSVVTWGASEAGGDSNGVDFDGPNDNLYVTQIFSSGGAFAALLSNGSVVTWGASHNGGDSSGVDINGPNDNLFVTQIFSTEQAFAALRSDGSVVTWGNSWAGGDSSGVDFNGPIDNLLVVQIYSTEGAFAALRSDGSIVAWGNSDSGGDSNAVDFNGINDNLSVTQIYSIRSAFAALLSDGSVVTWGDPLEGGNSDSVDFNGPNDNTFITQIYSSLWHFAALRSDGTVVTWGGGIAGDDGSYIDLNGLSDNLSVTHIFSTRSAYAALLSDGSVVTWGEKYEGGDSSRVDFNGPNDNLFVTQIFSSSEAFAALRSDGSVVTWGGGDDGFFDDDYGGDSSGVDFNGPGDNLLVDQIFSTASAFAALRSDGSVVTWGSDLSGGRSTGVDLNGTNDSLSVTKIVSTSIAFAALRSDGSAVTWGYSRGGGNSSNVDFNGPNDNLSITEIYSSNHAFAAVRSDGSVVTWGASEYGGDSSGIDFNGPNENLSVIQIYSSSGSFYSSLYMSLSSFAAVRSDGSVVSWGASGDSSGVDFNGPGDNLLIDQLFSTGSAFAALRSDGSVVAWGVSENGGDSGGIDFNGPNDNLSVTQISSTRGAFAVLLSDGSVVTWGDSIEGGNSSSVDFNGPNDNLSVTQIYSTVFAFAALRSDGSVVIWGRNYPGYISSDVDFNGPHDNLSVLKILTTDQNFAAIRSDGSVFTWGNYTSGGIWPGVDFNGSNDNHSVTQIRSTGYDFVALRRDGSVVTWGNSWAGGDSSGVDLNGPNDDLSVSQILSNYIGAFAALRSDGSVVTWGTSYYGGDSSGIDFNGRDNNLSVTQIFSADLAFAALRSDGSVVTWGDPFYGGSTTGVDFDGPQDNLQVVAFANPFTDDRFTLLASIPEITLSVSTSGGVSEAGSSSLIFTFSRTGPTTAALAVNYTVAGTATLGSDYTGIAASPAVKTVTFAAGSSTAVVSVDPTPDAESELDETVILTLAPGTGYTIGTSAAVTGTICECPDSLEPPTIDALTGDDVLTASEYETGLVIRGTGRAGASITIQFEDGFFSSSGAGDYPIYNVSVGSDGQWSLTLSPAQVGLLGVGDDIVIATQSWPSSDVVSESAYRLFTIEGAPAPSIAAISGDDLITIEEGLSGFTIQGTGVPGATIQLAFSSGISAEAGASTVVNQEGNWSLAITPQDVYGFGEGVESIEVSQHLSGTGFTSGVASRSFAIEPAPAPNVDAITADDTISAEEAQLGFSITGSGVPGATIIILFDSGVTPEAGSSAEVDPTGLWSLHVSASDIARIGPISESIDVYQVITQLGLTSSAVSHDFLIEDAPVPTIDAITGDDSISLGDLRSGFVISGRGLSGSTIHLEFNSGTVLQSGSTALVDIDGAWSLPVIQADVIGFDLGLETILVRQTIPAVGFTSAVVSHTYTVEAINLPPTGVVLNNTVSSLEENTSTLAAIKVADIAITDDALGSNTVSLTGADAAFFEVVGSGLFLKAGTSLNYEAKTSYSLTLSVSDPTVVGSAPVTTSYALAITDVNEAPTSVVLNNTVTSLEENTSTLAAIKVADIAITDDALGSKTVSLAGADAAFFEVVGSGLFLKAGTSLNYEAKASYAVTVSASDPTVAGSVPVTTSYALAVRDLNEAPTALNLSANAFDENIPASSQIALLSADDPDNTPQSFNYSLVSGAGSTHNLFFSVLGNALRITRSPDYEARSSYSIRLRATDQGGLFNERSVVLNVNDLPDSPTYSFSKSADVVYERGALAIGVSTTNVPAGTRLYWSLSGANITASDFSDGTLLGSVSLGDDGRASFSKVVAADGVIESDETLDVKFFNDAARSQQIGNSLSVTLKDPVLGVVSDGPDIITGTSANEVITGVPTASSLRGRGTVDRLTGGGGNDQFLLADRTGSYYNDGDPSTDGSTDIAVITDFNAGDSIRLFGSASLYQLSQGVYGGSAGLWIRILPTGGGVSERIGFVQSATLSSLNLNSASQFTYLN